ncbi:proteasome subunit alpha type-2 [Platysternon megacephalum]|uniref:Proteasome subunit alpha type-2 n=1 Tax=Platysternon megacephalum TaxID=55544 RepID=A0A4D9E182_9SAUR|nr:proteasome subunit alpha type-2 [Platysternon megacephalum]
MRSSQKASLRRAEGMSPYCDRREPHSPPHNSISATSGKLFSQEGHVWVQVIEPPSLPKHTHSTHKYGPTLMSSDSVAEVWLNSSTNIMIPALGYLDPAPLKTPIGSLGGWIGT